MIIKSAQQANCAKVENGALRVDSVEWLTALMLKTDGNPLILKDAKTGMKLEVKEVKSNG